MIETSLVGMFFAAFLAATLIPFSSEVMLSALLLSGQSPAAIILVATAGNVLGSLTNYAIGYWAGAPLAKRWLRMSEADLQKAQQRFEKYGWVALCFAWVPIIGDPITVVAGLLRVNLLGFLFLVTLGKGGRYLIVGYTVMSSM